MNKTILNKTVLIFGLISGAISSLMMLAALPLENRIGQNQAEILGYTTLVLSFLLVFFGIRSYRDNLADGEITFVKAFGVGLAITLISCVLYVVTWEIIYFNFMHDFMDKYAARAIEKARAAGATPAALTAQTEQLRKYKEMYENPLFNAAITFLEPFPVGFVITLISAAVLRKRPRAQGAQAASVRGV
jgi:hypothetical protein